MLRSLKNADNIAASLGSVLMRSCGLMALTVIWSSSSHAQPATGQLLILSGFNSKAATSAEMMKRLLSVPAHRFVLQSRGGKQFYVYADPQGCGCAYVGDTDAMNRYRTNYKAISPETLASGKFLDPEQNLINSMEGDDASSQFNKDVFGPDF